MGSRRSNHYELLGSYKIYFNYSSSKFYSNMSDHETNQYLITFKVSSVPLTDETEKEEK